jgi:hypothetical protein
VSHLALRLDIAASFGYWKNTRLTLQFDQTGYLIIGAATANFNAGEVDELSEIPKYCIQYDGINNLGDCSQGCKKSHRTTLSDVDTGF